jgi:hypothetical protein
VNKHWIPTYAEARAAHIDAAANTEGWGHVPRPGGRNIGRLVPFLRPNKRAAGARPVTDHRIVPNTPALQAEAKAKEKRQDRAQFEGCK